MESAAARNSLLISHIIEVAVQHRLVSGIFSLDLWFVVAKLRNNFELLRFSEIKSANKEAMICRFCLMREQSGPNYLEPGELQKQLLGARVAEADGGLLVVTIALYVDDGANAKALVLDDHSHAKGAL